MSLLHEIRDAAVDSRTPLADVLRKSKILAAQLDHAEFTNWIAHELNGYSAVKELPAYRILDVQSKGTFLSPRWHAKNVPIPPLRLPEELRRLVETAPMLAGVGAYSDLVKSPDAHGAAELPWPNDITAVFGGRIFPGMQCVQAWQEIPVPAIAAFLDTVRNKVLDFVLTIEREAPQLGEPGIKPPAHDTVNQVFHSINIYGSASNVAIGSSSVSQRLQTAQGDLSSLMRDLSDLGVERSDLQELEVALRSDSAPPAEGSLGPKVSAWFGKMIGKAASGAWRITVPVATEALQRALRGYLGLPV